MANVVVVLTCLALFQGCLTSAVSAPSGDAASLVQVALQPQENEAQSVAKAESELKIKEAEEATQEAERWSKAREEAKEKRKREAARGAAEERSKMLAWYANAWSKMSNKMQRLEKAMESVTAKREHNIQLKDMALKEAEEYKAARDMVDQSRAMYFKGLEDEWFEEEAKVNGLEGQMDQERVAIIDEEFQYDQAKKDADVQIEHFSDDAAHSDKVDAMEDNLLAARQKVELTGRELARLKSELESLASSKLDAEALFNKTTEIMANHTPEEQGLDEQEQAAEDGYNSATERATLAEKEIDKAHAESYRLATVMHDAEDEFENLTNQHIQSQNTPQGRHEATKEMERLAKSLLELKADMEKKAERKAQTAMEAREAAVAAFADLMARRRHRLLSHPLHGHSSEHTDENEHQDKHSDEHTDEVSARVSY